MITLSTLGNRQLASFLIFVTPDTSRSNQISLKSQIRLTKQLKLSQTLQFLKVSSERMRNKYKAQNENKSVFSRDFSFSKTTCSSLCLEELIFLDARAVAFRAILYGCRVFNYDILSLHNEVELYSCLSTHHQ